MNRERLFLTGYTRSGKTVVLKMLNSSPGVHITNESRVYRFLQRSSTPEQFFKYLTTFNGVYRSEINKLTKMVEYPENKLSWLYTWEEYTTKHNWLVGEKDGLLEQDTCYITDTLSIGLQPKVLFMYRDIRDVMSMTLRKSKDRKTHDDDALAHWGEVWANTMEAWPKIKNKFDHMTLKFEDMADNPRAVLDELGQLTSVPSDHLRRAYKTHYDPIKACIGIWPNYMNDQCLSSRVRRILREVGYSVNNIR